MGRNGENAVSHCPFERSEGKQSGYFVIRGLHQGTHADVHHHNDYGILWTMCYIWGLS